MTRRILLASAIALLATAATAAARPSLVTDQACYAPADVMRFTGQGFTPGAAVSLLFAHNGRMGDFMATADAAGRSSRMSAPPGSATSAKSRRRSR